MAYTAYRTWVTGELVTAGYMNQDIRDNGLAVLAFATWTTDHVAAAQTETNTAYDDMTTVGPSVTVTTGTSALVMLCAEILNTGGSSFMGFAVSGASTIAASDSFAIVQPGGGGAGNTTCSAFWPLSGLTAGSNTFTAKYRVTGGTGTFGLRSIAVKNQVIV